VDVVGLQVRREGGGVGVDLVEVEAPGGVAGFVGGEGDAAWFAAHYADEFDGRLVRLHERRPEIMRLCTWQRLERTDGEPNPAGVAYARAQIDAIAQAQKTGDLPAHFHPGFLLGLVLHLATGWVSVSPEFEAAIDVPSPAERARHVEDAIRTLLGQPASA
jgi:Tetracyclin repressor-like, C-terminal domain